MNLLAPICRGFHPLPESPSNCISVPRRIIKEPDPQIYDQALELAQGRVPTWDNPDMLTHNPPDYTALEELSVTVHNLSGEASAFNTQVELAWTQFGIGLDRLVIGSVPANLQRAGFPGASQTVRIPTPPAAKAARRFNLFVTVRHPYDRDRTNNEGEQAFDSQRTRDVGRSMTFRFPVRNRLAATTTATVLITPVKWGVNASPSVFALNPGQQRDVDVSFVIPNGIAAGTEETFSVYATTPMGFLGGVALVAHVD